MDLSFMFAGETIDSLTNSLYYLANRSWEEPCRPGSKSLLERVVFPPDYVAP